MKSRPKRETGYMKPGERKERKTRPISHHKAQQHVHLNASIGDESASVNEIALITFVTSLPTVRPSSRSNANCILPHAIGVFLAIDL
jgi:hypothetical protein